eukprot:SAG11_NODE_7167_length_1184_cov_1.740092_1_plen_212_part_01
MWALRLPVHALHEYFGPRAGAYFAFMDAYLLCLGLPSALAAALVLARVRGKLGGLVAQAAIKLGVGAWAVLVARSMRTHMRRIPLRRRDSAAPTPVAAPSAVRPGQGRRRRIAAAAATAALTASMLAAVGVLITMSLNLQGYVLSTTSRFRVPLLQRWASAGGLFDTNSTVRGMAPVVGHSLLMNFLNGKYTELCRRRAARPGGGGSALVIV